MDFYGRSGGIIVTPEEIETAIRKLAAEGKG